MERSIVMLVSCLVMTQSFSTIPRQPRMTLQYPKWTGDSLLSSMMNTLIQTKPLFELMKVGARQVLISNAEKKGIPWRVKTEELLQQVQELETLKKQVEDQQVQYPEYYLQQFHAYSDGNLNWLAAAECESATYSMATRVWPKEALQAEEAQQRLRNSYLDELEAYKPGLKLRSILDVGCSVGVSTRALRNRYPQAEITGMDLSPHFLAVAKKCEDKKLKPISWVHQKAEDTKLPSSSVDAVFLTFVVHELPSQATDIIFREAYRIMRPGGVIAVTDNDPRSPVIQNLPAPISILMKSTEPYCDQYYLLDMEGLLRDIGFQNIKYVRTDPRHRTIYATK